MASDTGWIESVERSLGGGSGKDHDDWIVSECRIDVDGPNELASGDSFK